MLRAKGYHNFYFGTIKNFFDSSAHVPPPPPNQIIHVKMAYGKVAKMSYDPMWLFGKILIIKNTEKKLGVLMIWWEKRRDLIDRE